ncbi:MAG: hypothetical protein HYX65_01945 [Gemmatimonadetes bacterium]|nr:hypothetical protein [Gemmatimonadota bacterium]
MGFRVSNRSLAGVLVAGLALAGPLAGQSPAAQGPDPALVMPPRPMVGGNADSNDARAYVELATELIVKEPLAAANAFHWAQRLDPSSAAALYGRAVATILADDELVRARFEGARSDKARAAFRLADSLDARARLLDPFLHRVHDKLFLISYVARRNHIGNLGQALGAIESALGDMEPAVQGWYFYSTEQWKEALQRYADALRRGDDLAFILQRRAEIFQYTRQYDSAFQQLRQAIAEHEKREKSRVVWIYAPKALLEHQSGLLLERTGRAAEAREAYGRALLEDISYAPAHVRLAALALQAADTVAAAGEFVLAAQAAPLDAFRRYQCAYGLVLARKPADAIEHLRAAIALEPWFADPRFLLAKLADDGERYDEAVVQYRAFLERARERDPQRGFASRRLATLSARKAGGLR